VQSYIDDKRKVIITGDLNSPHTKLDLFEIEVLEDGKYDREIKWIEEILKPRNDNGSIGVIDAFRYLHKNVRKYSWWRVRKRIDLGYRIDYFFVDEDFKDSIKECDMMVS